MSAHLERAADPAAVAAAAVERITTAIESAVAERGRCVLSLAGGSTPKAAYTLLARRAGVPWPRVLLLFGDERCVAPDHADSNYRMVTEALLSPLTMKPRVLRMQGEATDPAQAARDYESALRGELGPDGAPDLALLGIGTDGHTASLFPGRDALRERSAWCVATLAPDGVTARLTLTVPFLARSRALLFLAAGPEKAAILPAVLEDRPDPERFPAQFFLRDAALHVRLIVDEAAARGLRG